MQKAAEQASKESDLCTEIVGLFGLFTLNGNAEIQNSSTPI